MSIPGGLSQIPYLQPHGQESRQTAWNTTNGIIWKGGKPPLHPAKQQIKPQFYTINWKPYCGNWRAELLGVAPLE